MLLVKFVLYAPFSESSLAMKCVILSIMQAKLSHSENSFGNAVTDQQQEHFIASKSSSPLKEVSGTEVLFSSASSSLLGANVQV